MALSTAPDSSGHPRCIAMNAAIDTAQKRVPRNLAAEYERIGETEPIDEAEVMRLDEELDGPCSGLECVRAASLQFRRFMRADLFVEFNQDGVYRPASEGEFMDQLESEPGRRRVEDRLHGHISGLRKQAWIVPDEDVRGEFGNEDPDADAIVALLGLDYARGTSIVELRFQLFGPAFVPTFIDGILNEAYCSWRDSSDFGWTWRTDRQRRGVREAVVSKMPVPPGTRVAGVGQTVAEPSVPNFEKMLSR